jgi:hypothetical protein
LLIKDLRFDINSSESILYGGGGYVLILKEMGVGGNGGRAFAEYSALQSVVKGLLRWGHSIGRWEVREA